MKAELLIRRFNQLALALGDQLNTIINGLLPGVFANFK
jgi:hypothetical protein